MPSPSPRLPPVTTTLRIVPDQLAGLGDVEMGYEADHGWDLMLGERLTANLEDLALQLLARPRPFRLVEKHVGNDDGAGKRIFARAHKRHPDVRMSIDHRFDFLGMHF